jgi:ABC-type uncharacterized transport system involved in gliding motility auxiliary subunit
MNKRTTTSTTAIGLLVGLVLFFALNVLANAVLRSWRIDLTEDKLFTLTQGTKTIARGVKETIRLKLFVSREQVENFPSVASYARRVEELLEEYERISGGMIELSVIDPEPYSEAESEAVEAGLGAVPTGVGLDKIYFGLVATNAVGDKELVRFFDPGQERFLEYEISRIVYALDNPKKTVVGVLSSLPLGGGGFNPMTGQGSPRWPALSFLDTLFETRMLADGLEQIPDDVDVLWIVHPKGFSDATRYALDHFVLGGGKTIVCLDAWCDSDTAGDDPSNPYAGMSADKRSDLPGLLEAWGVELVPGRIAADRKNALLVRSRTEEWPMIVWIGLGPDEFDQDDAVTSRLGEVRLATAGILRPAAGATTTLTPLLMTSEDSMDVDQGAVQFRADARQMLADFVPRHERYTLGARVTGPAQTAFPDGKPNAEEGAAAEQRTAGDVSLVVIADVDFLHDRFWLQQTMFGPIKQADNGDLIVNAVENLAGGNDLIGIRGRAGFARPFERVEEIRRAAEERYLDEEKRLQARLKAADDRIGELLQQQDPGSLILTPEIEAELQKSYDEKAQTNLQMRDVQYNLKKDIRRLGAKLKWINIGLLPALITLTAVALGTAGRRRRTKR